MVPPKKTAPLSNGTNRKETSTMSYQKKETVPAKADGKIQNGNFRTDAAISGNRAGGERVLQRWQPDSSPSNLDDSLEKSGSRDKWDQFKTNEKLFGLKTDYDENIYTTQIDKNHPKYRERLAQADRKAKEIESSVATTSHVAEERVMDFVGGDAGGDEEDNGVKRQQQQNDFPPLPGGRENKYTPPARRAPTGSATVKGAPFDPAIISSQLKTQKPQANAKPADDAKPRATSTEPITPVVPAVSKPTESKVEPTAEAPQKPADVKDAKATPQTATPLKPSAATSRTISPQAKERAQVPSATSTVEHDVLVSFKAFASQQRTNAEKQRTTKAKADKEVKLIELKKFASSFKLPTPVPVDLIGIIAKDPAKQKAIQEKANRDAAECQRRKTEDKVAQEKKQSATAKEGQTATASQGVQNTQSRTTGAPASTQPAAAAARHPGARQSFVPPPYQQYRNGAPHMGPGGRQTQGLAARIQNQKMGDMRQPPTGPANAVDPSYLRRGPMANHIGNKLNPNSHEFRPSALAASFNPNGHPSAGSSPKSALNNAVDSSTTPSSTGVVVFITRKKTAANPTKCSILSYVKAQPKPEGKNWADNDGFKPSFDTPPTWRQAQDDEKPESTMRMSYTELFDRQPFATQPTPNPSHVMPQLAHQHQLPFHLQQGAHSVAPRASPHVPSVPMHPGQHGPIPHGPFNGADDHRMMHSNSSQSYSSPRVGPVSAAYPPNMNSSAQVPYGQNGMPFMSGTPQQMGGHFNRSFSNNPGYMPQGMQMGTPVMIQPQFINPQGMPTGQMQMYPGAPPFMPPGAVAPQPIPGTNGYPSPGRPAAPMMVHQGSQQGQAIYGMSPGMQYQQPVFTQQQGQMNNMRGGYGNQGYQQYGTSPQLVHQYPQQHRNGSNNFKNFQGHNQHQGPQGNHQVPSGPHGRTPDGTDEAK
ncbi:LsmAD domain-containing protein [Seiridium cupressi]